MKNINNILIPNVNRAHKVERSKEKIQSSKNDFEKELLSKILNEQNVENKSEVSFSKHAKKRIEERNLNLDSQEFLKIRGAIDKLKNKGGKDSLVITNNAAYIVDVDNETVVTAMGKDDMAENVFTKIDSTLFVN